MNNSSKRDISLIIPIYNGSAYLPRCLDSVKAQSYSNFECILIDDGSTDDSRFICEKYTNEDKRFKLVHQENKGVSAARNRGISEATSEFIAFSDSDDELNKEYLSSLMSEDLSIDFVISGFCFSNTVNNTTKRRIFNNSYQKEINEQVFKKAIELKANELIYAKRFKRDLINKHKLRFQESLSLGEDTLFTTEYMMHCNSWLLCNRCEYIYYSGDHESLSSFSENNFQKLITASNLQAKAISKRFPSVVKSDIWYSKEWDIYYSCIFHTLNTPGMTIPKKLNALRCIFSHPGYINALSHSAHSINDGKIIQFALKLKSAIFLFILNLLISIKHRGIPLPEKLKQHH